MSSRSAAPINATTAIAFSDPLPAEVDVVVIGGGVIGITSALYLNRLGLRTCVVEKGRVAGEQSSRNWGWSPITGIWKGHDSASHNVSRNW